MAGVLNYSPTHLDVAKLIEAFGIPDVGIELTHTSVSDVVGYRHKTHRYRTVTVAWRRFLRVNHNVEMGAVAGVGYRALNPHERIHSSIGKTRTAGRMVRRAVAHAAQVETDDPVLCRKQESLMKLGAAMEFAATRMAREIKLEPTQRVTPRVQPPGAGVSA